MKYALVLTFLLLNGNRSFSQQPVLMTEGARTLGAKHILIGAGASFFTKSATMIPDAPRSEWRAGLLALRLGVADNVNFDLEWRGRLIAKSANGTPAQDWGDLTVATKIHILDEGETLPAIGIRSAVKLPNTTHSPHKLGSNQTDYFFHILAAKTVSSVEFHVNGGLGIIGNPVYAGFQDDIYIAGVAAVVPAGNLPRLFLELYGFTGSAAENNKLLARLGFVVEVWDIELNIFGSKRIAGSSDDFGSAFEASEDFGVGVFVSRLVRL
jgi:hypothetical protein